MILLYKCHDITTCEINVNMETKEVSIKNLTDKQADLPFYKGLNPTFTDVMDLIKSRCIPMTRDELPRILRKMGLNKYDPIEIIKRTKGKSLSDYHSLEIEGQTIEGDYEIPELLGNQHKFILNEER